MNKRLTIKAKLLECFDIVEQLMAMESNATFMKELIQLKVLLSDAIALIDTDDLDSDGLDYSRIVDIVDWAIRIFTAKEIWTSLQ